MHFSRAAPTLRSPDPVSCSSRRRCAPPLRDNDNPCRKTTLCTSPSHPLNRRIRPETRWARRPRPRCAHRTARHTARGSRPAHSARLSGAARHRAPSARGARAWQHAVHHGTRPRDVPQARRSIQSRLARSRALSRRGINRHATRARRSRQGTRHTQTRWIPATHHARRIAHCGRRSTGRVAAARCGHESLAELQPRLARVVECRFFGGLTEEEIAEALGITVRTVQRDWAKARMLLQRELES